MVTGCGSMTQHNLLKYLFWSTVPTVANPPKPRVKLSVKPLPIATLPNGSNLLELAVFVASPKMLVKSEILPSSEPEISEELWPQRWSRPAIRSPLDQGIPTKTGKS